MSGLSLETYRSNLKAVSLTILELLAFIAQKFRGSRDPGHAPFRKNLRGRVWTVPGNMHVKLEVRSFNRFGASSVYCGKIFKGSRPDYLETCLSDLKSVALAVLELLGFNAQKFRGSRDPGHAPFQKSFNRSWPDYHIISAIHLRVSTTACVCLQYDAEMCCLMRWLPTHIRTSFSCCCNWRKYRWRLIFANTISSAFSSVNTKTIDGFLR